MLVGEEGCKVSPLRRDSDRLVVLVGSCIRQSSWSGHLFVASAAVPGDQSNLVCRDRYEGHGCTPQPPCRRLPDYRAVEMAGERSGSDIAAGPWPMKIVHPSSDAPAGWQNARR